MRCKEHIHDDEDDDDTPRRLTKRKNVRSNRKGVHADDYASHTQKKQKVSLANTEDEEADKIPETDTANEADEQEETHVSLAAKRQQKKIDSSEK